MSLGNAESVERYGNYELAIEPGTSSQALITLSGIGDMSSGHIAFEFRESMRAALGSVHGLFLRDTRRSWYNDPHGWEQLLSRLRDYLTDNQIRDITCFGLSMGGFGALILASELPVTRVVAMSPRTLLSPQPYFDRRNRDLLDRIDTLSHADALARLNPFVDYTLLFSIDEPEDTLHAFRALCSPVRLLATRGDHNIGHTLRMAGQLPAFMQAMMSGSTGLSSPEFGFAQPPHALQELAQAHLEAQPIPKIAKLAQHLPPEWVPGYVRRLFL